MRVKKKRSEKQCLNDVLKIFIDRHVRYKTPNDKNVYKQSVQKNTLNLFLDKTVRKKQI